MNVRVVISITITDNTDLKELRAKISEKLRELSNPVREDEGILTVNGVRTQYKNQANRHMGECK